MRKLPLAKQLTFVAIVGAVSFATSFLLAVITAGVPDDRQSTPSWFIGMLFGVVAGSIYLLLSGNRKVATADGATRTRALTGADGGEAQLLIFRQGFVGKLAGVDVSVDGVLRTQLKSPRFAALSLSPGRHEVIATVQGKSTQPALIDLASGETAALRIDMGIGRASLVREPDLAAVRRTLAGIPMVEA